MHDIGTTSESTRAGPLASSEHHQIISGDAKEQQLFYILIIAKSVHLVRTRLQQQESMIKVTNTIIILQLVSCLNYNSCLLQWQRGKR